MGRGAHWMMLRGGVHRSCTRRPCVGGAAGLAPPSVCPARPGASAAERRPDAPGHADAPAGRRGAQLLRHLRPLDVDEDSRSASSALHMRQMRVRAGQRPSAGAWTTSNGSTRVSVRWTAASPLRASDRGRLRVPRPSASWASSSRTCERSLASARRRRNRAAPPRRRGRGRPSRGAPPSPLGRPRRPRRRPRPSPRGPPARGRRRREPARAPSRWRGRGGAGRRRKRRGAFVEIRYRW